jgi:S-formylglutathione hydrolase FrmB
VAAARLTGRWQELSFASEALRGNPLGDPSTRPVYVWTPPSYDAGERRYPSLYVLQGLLGLAPGWFNVRAWEPSFPERVEELAPEAVVVLVDAFSSLGGSQFLDAPAVGRYHTYLCDELVPWIDERFRTAPAAAHRGLQGHSSGGYGAMVNAMLRPELFGGFAAHAGDALFEASYAREFPEAARALRDRYDGSLERFWADFRSGRPPFSKPADHVLVNVGAMSAVYSDGELPFDPETGELREEVWRRWLARDPVRMAREARHAEALRGMRAIWIDAGRGDEFFLDLGAAAFHRAVEAAGAAPEAVHFELFEGRHGGVGWRYPLALSFLAERLGRSITLTPGTPKPTFS